MKRMMILVSLSYLSACAAIVVNNSPQTVYRDAYINRINPALVPLGPFAQEDLEYMFKTVYGEVRNQGDKEIRAVCQVIYNRWQSGYFGSSLKEVVLADKQFSVWNYDDPQRPLLLDSLVNTYGGYERVQSICTSVVQERLQGMDTSNGINYFYHPYSMKAVCVNKSYSRHHHRYKCTRWGRAKPRWIYTYEYKVRIGQGIFFRKQIS